MNGGQPYDGAMPWYEVVIANNDVANEIESSLVKSCRRAVLESETPPDALQAYRGRNDRWERVFYFYFASPPAEPVADRLEAVLCPVMSTAGSGALHQGRFPVAPIA